MNTENIRRYAEIMKEMGLTALEIRKNGSIRLERTAGAVCNDCLPDTNDSKSIETHKDSPGVSVITSPAVGMFYTSPAENSPPFVNVGSIVHKGDVVCIVEAMKLMNEITAEVDGEVIEVLAVSGAVVEYGQPLFRIKRST